MCLEVTLQVKLGGLAIQDEFIIVGGLSQDAILGVNFLQKCEAVLDFRAKRMSLFDGTVSLPLTTDIDGSRVIRTVERLRIPANSEAIFRARIPKSHRNHRKPSQNLRPGIKGSQCSHQLFGRGNHL